MKMKTTRFLFTIIAFGAFALGVAYAGESSAQPSEKDSPENHAAGVAPADPAHGKQAPAKTNPTDAKPSSPKEDAHAAVPPKEEGRAPAPPKEEGRAAARSIRASPIETRPRTTSGNNPPQPSAMSPHPTSATKSGPAKALPPSALKTASPPTKAGFTTVGSMGKKTGNQTSARLPGGDAPPLPGPGGVRGRGAIAALAGDSLGLGVKNPPAALVGANPKLKP
jgi:hypothetical protein